ncbi:ABC-2 type transport system ATP-binding protein [Lentibacillus halodurans]|uniref:ABC-2 type transport system ATP-binding protein n=1 Tax=Lentibacillus halodurans TaxID=237679 RepID=A0A1I0ZIZ3_9BACI|nr:ABC transporter ATP-binding protein [Lentibacillus halodurans]SFB24500.1 ABC-2 type transport system ATP-binding protein [Lentibacillus halodurans]
MLNVQALSKVYGKRKILDTVSFAAKPGEIIGLVGENGAGKSTMLHILAALSKPTSGTITLHNKSYETESKLVKKEIGFVPQDIALWDDFTVEENMLFFEKLAWHHKNKDELKQLCRDMKLDHWDEPVKTLSGGMKRKLNIAISLIHEPNLLLLDEPTVGIDLKSRKEIGAYLSDLAKQDGKIILYTSHDMDEIMQLCDRIYCIGNDPFYYQVLKEYGENPVLL